MKKLNWQSLIAHYLVISQKNCVSIQYVLELYKYIIYRATELNTVLPFQKLTPKKSAIVKELRQLSSHFTYNSCIGNIEVIRNIDIELFPLDEKLRLFINEFWIKMQLQNASSIPNVKYPQEQFKETFILFIENKTYEVKKKHILFLMEFESELTEDMILFLKYYVDLEYALYKNEYLYIYTKLGNISFKTSKPFYQMLLSTLV